MHEKFKEIYKKVSDVKSGSHCITLIRQQAMRGWTKVGLAVECVVAMAQPRKAEPCSMGICFDSGGVGEASYSTCHGFVTFCRKRGVIVQKFTFVALFLHFVQVFTVFGKK